jgi:AraC-like DNA-binding protein
MSQTLCSEGESIPASKESACLLLSNGFTVFVGSVMDASEHAHHAIQVTLGLTGAFKIWIDGKEKETESLVLSKDVKHRFTAAGSRILLILIEPESSLGRRIVSRMTTPYQELPYARGDLGDIDYRRDDGKAAVQALKAYLRRSLRLGDVPSGYDGRVSTVLSFIKRKKYVGKIKPLAELACLSESRLAHLFRVQAGISLKYYLLWEKLTVGVDCVTRGSSLTEAAYAAGFSDSAHMSRTFKRMFGINLRSIFQNSGFVQVLIPDAD